MEIQGFSSYLIYPDGRVFSKKSNRFLKLRENEKGYYRTQLWNNSKLINVFIHRLVAEHYIPNPENKKEVDHKNRNPCDNRVENLRWATRKENANNRGMSKNNKSGHKYIMYDNSTNRWRFKYSKYNNYKSKYFKSKTDALCYKYIHLLKMKSILSL